MLQFHCLACDKDVGVRIDMLPYVLEDTSEVCGTIFVICRECGGTIMVKETNFVKLEG